MHTSCSIWIATILWRLNISKHQIDALCITQFWHGVKWSNWILYCSLWKRRKEEFKVCVCVCMYVWVCVFVCSLLWSCALSLFVHLQMIDRDREDHKRKTLWSRKLIQETHALMYRKYLCVCMCARACVVCQWVGVHACVVYICACMHANTCVHPYICMFVTSSEVLSARSWQISSIMVTWGSDWYLFAADLPCTEAARFLLTGRLCTVETDGSSAKCGVEGGVGNALIIESVWTVEAKEDCWQCTTSGGLFCISLTATSLVTPLGGKRGSFSVWLLQRKMPVLSEGVMEGGHSGSNRSSVKVNWALGETVTLVVCVLEWENISVEEIRSIQLHSFEKYNWPIFFFFP